MERMKYVHKVSVGKSQGKRPLVGPRHRCVRIILK
jgi:hypothetical protein